MDSFIFEKGSIKRKDLRTVLVKEILDGPYIIQVNSDVTGKIFYIGLHGDVQWYFNQVSLPSAFIGQLVDVYNNWLMYVAGIDGIHDKSKDMLFGELLDLVAKHKKAIPRKITFEGGWPETDQDRAEIVRIEKKVQGLADFV